MACARRDDSCRGSGIFRRGLRVTPVDLQTRATKLFGRRWKVALAKELGIHLATVYKWLPQGDKAPQHPVPRTVDMFFELREQRAKLARFAKSLTK